jgi:hypothetical protein
MDPTVEIAIIGSLSVTAAALSPIVQARIANRQRQRERDEDRADRKEVAAKVDAAADQAREAARLLSDAQQVTISKTDEVATEAKAATAETRSQLKQIHTLVNSDMTAARQGELDQVRLNLTTLRKVVLLGAEMGRPPADEDSVAIETAEARIKELEGILADRLSQMRVIEAEADVGKS